MRKIMALIIWVVAAIAVTSNVLAFDEEEDMFKKRKKWIDKVALAQTYANASVSIDDPHGKAKKQDFDEALREKYEFVINDLAGFLGADPKHIKLIEEGSLEKSEFETKYNGSISEVMFGTYCYSYVTLKYKEEEYSYGVKSYYSYGGKPGSALAILDPEVTNGETHSVTGSMPPLLGFSDVPEEEVVALLSSPEASVLPEDDPVVAQPEISSADGELVQRISLEEMIQEQQNTLPEGVTMTGELVRDDNSDILIDKF